MVIYGNEFETKEKQKLTKIEKLSAIYTGMLLKTHSSAPRPLLKH